MQAVEATVRNQISKEGAHACDREIVRLQYFPMSLLPRCAGGNRMALQGLWVLQAPGRTEQIIRLLFDEPQQVSCIQLLFHEDKQARTQEFLLRCLQDKHQSYREIVRQQHHFSPPGTIRELEEYAVDLADVLVLELKIVPDITGGAAHASIVRFRVG